LRKKQSLISNRELEKLKREPNLIQLVRARISDLEQVGQEWKSCCPFHDEHTASFTIRSDDGIWLYKCFGCGANGNLIQFVQNFDRISFSDAVQKVNTELGWRSGKQDVEATFTSLKEKKENVVIPLEKMRQAEDALAGSPEALRWLSGRGISLETAKQFHIGFVQSARAVNPHHSWCDAGWIVFPTIEGDKIISLKYRSIQGKKTETGEPGFLRKSGMATVLFGMDKIEPFEDVYVVEGEPDALAMAQAGYVAVSLPSAGYNPSPDEKDRLMTANRVFLAGDTDGPGEQAMTKLWTELRDRTYKIKWPEGMKDANQTYLEHCSGDVEIFRQEVERLKKKALEQPIPFMFDLRETLRAGNYIQPKDNPARLRFPWPSIDSWVAVLPGDVMAMSATETGTGKALANGTPVLTVSGWRPIESLTTSDFVFGINGQKIPVLGVFPQGERDLFEVSFSCGTKIITDAQHYWTVESSNHNQKLILTTAELKNKIDRKKETKTFRSYPWKVPAIEPVQFPDKTFALNPYLVGVLIGDGGLTHTSIVFSTGDEEILNKVKRLVPPDIEVTHIANYDYRLARKGHKTEKRSQLRLILANLGLLGKRSEHKFIPTPYLFGSVAQRLELLRGLLDTDGTVSRKTGSVSYNTSSRKLAEDMRHLVFSLGGFATIRSKKTKRLPSYNVSINMPSDVRLFWLSRKHVLAAKRKGWRRIRTVTAIEPAGKGQATCIKVGAPDGLFLTKDFIPTHNTSWLMNILLENAIKQGKTVVNFSAEVSPAQYAVRAAAYLLHKRKEEITSEDMETAADLIGEAKFYNGYKPGTNWKDVIELLVWAKRRLGADILCLDHLHFLTRSERDETRAQSEAMRMLKDLAVQYNCIVIVVGQPRKPLANHRGREAVTQDLKGSESFGSDASQVFILHRDRRSNGDDENMPIFDSVCKVKLDKSRESEPKATKLFFDGARCTFAMLDTRFSNQGEYDE
jgi:replicative DNA helicase